MHIKFQFNIFTSNAIGNLIFWSKPLRYKKKRVAYEKKKEREYERMREKERY